MYELRPYYTPPASSHIGGAVSPGEGGIALSTSRNEKYFGDLEVISLREELERTARPLVRIYGRILLLQPFQVSRLLLQVGDWRGAGNSGDKQEEQSLYCESESSDEEIDYFTGEALSARKKASHTKQASHVRPSAVADDDKRLLSFENPPGLFVLINALSDKEGARGLWRAVNSTFMIEALGLTVEAWVSGFLSAVFGIADPHFVDAVRSIHPGTSIITGVLSCVATAIILSPLDTIRTRLLVSTFNTEPRSFRKSVWRLKSYTSPLSVLVPSALCSLCTCAIDLGAPYFLFIRFGVDRYNSKFTYNFFNLLVSVSRTTLRYPLETILRRAQVHSLGLPPESLIVRVRPYTGLVDSLWNLVCGREPISSLFTGFRIPLVATICEWALQVLEPRNTSREKF